PSVAALTLSFEASTSFARFSFSSFNSRCLISSSCRWRSSMPGVMNSIPHVGHGNFCPASSRGDSTGDEQLEHSNFTRRFPENVLDTVYFICYSFPTVRSRSLDDRGGGPVAWA